MALKLTRGSKWVLIGDSITDCGRAQPIDEGLFNEVGVGADLLSVFHGGGLSHL